MNGMHFRADMLLDASIILLIIFGIWQFRTPRGAVRGNMASAAALFASMLLVAHRQGVLEIEAVMIALAVGSLLGWLVAVRVTMIQIPAMVAFQHGAGGVAAFIVSFVELTSPSAETTAVGRVAGVLGLIIGAATFSASMVASGKLSNLLRQTPVRVRMHGWLLAVLAAVVAALGVVAFVSQGPWTAAWAAAAVAASVALGILFAVRIGGADMPVLISFLNATAGLAAAFCGIVIGSRLLVACGATVAASGSILTQVMCRAMNRSLVGVFVGFSRKAEDGASLPRPVRPEPASAPAARRPADEKPPARPSGDDFGRVVETVRSARNVVVIPGYGMAVAKAQFKVVELAKKLEKMGKEVTFAIHPVAGRMPGHMNVLLAEADVDYEKLLEMDVVNPKLKTTDAVLVVGACDVVNPAAISVEGTPISGMPILKAHEARCVVVCNLDDRPGYSGVSNPLYAGDNAVLLLGDAEKTVSRILDALG